MDQRRGGGAHVGCFTPFELDITDLVKQGQKNVIAIAVRSDEAVDKMPWASLFAGHKLCGILRKIYLFAVPQVNVADVYVLTTFDKDYRDAALTAQGPDRQRLGPRSERAPTATGLARPARDRGRRSQPVTVEAAGDPAGPDDHPGGEDARAVAPEMGRGAPEPLRPEHRTAARRPGRWSRPLQRIGFRQVEIRGNQVFINNLPVKYHGVVWHETYPGRGRSLTGDMLAQGHATAAGDELQLHPLPVRRRAAGGRTGRGLRRGRHLPGG